MSETKTAPEAWANPAFDLPLPVETINDALPNLRRPFAPAAVKWKVQATYPKDGPAEGAIMVGYIDARLVSARLNHVVGGAWSEKPVRVADNSNALLGELTVFDQTHVDLGVGQGRGEDMKAKATHSDALKRPAVRFGIGEYLYAMPEVRITVNAEGGETPEGAPIIRRRKDGKVPGFLPDAIFTFLRKHYEDWLQAEGIDAFGPVLDHGDAAGGSVGEGVAPDEAEAPAPQAALEDDEAKQLADQCRALRDAIRKVDADALPAQSFDAAMAQREHSHDRLRDFVANLTELKADIERFGTLEGEAREKLGEADSKKAIDRAKRRASRRERVESLEKALADAAGKGDEKDA